jgi:hypothetical protein
MQSATGLLVIAVYAIAGWDPMVKLFFFGGTFGALGILLALTATSAAVIAYFARVAHDSDATVWQRIIAPAIATVALVVVDWWTLSNYSTLLGVEPGNVWAWVLPTAYLVVAVIGVAWALVLAGTRRDVYERIGRGVNTTDGLAVPAGGLAVGGARV